MQGEIIPSSDDITNNIKNALKAIDARLLFRFYLNLIQHLNDSFTESLLVRKPLEMNDDAALKLIAAFLTESNNIIFPSDVSEVLNIPYEQTLRIFERLKILGAIDFA